MVWFLALAILLAGPRLALAAQGSWDRGTWHSDPAGAAYTTHGGARTGSCASSVATRATLANVRQALGCTSMACPWHTRWHPENTSIGECPCVDEWHGVECDAHGAIVGLDLSYNGLIGTISADIASLPALRSLKLNSNAISGTVPEAVAYLTNLKRLDVHNNNLAKTTVGGWSLAQTVANIPSLEHVFVDNA